MPAGPALDGTDAASLRDNGTLAVFHPYCTNIVSFHQE
jgi:hypothetical protein